MQNHQKVLVALRQIIRAIDLHSKKLERESGLTGPQLLILHMIREAASTSVGALARSVSLSQATVTSILDRLERKQYLTRTRDSTDKRKVLVALSPLGEETLDQAPTLLQKEFIQAFSELAEWEQTLLVSSLQRVAEMMNVHQLETTPFLEEPNVAPLHLINEENIVEEGGVKRDSAKEK